MLKDVNDSDKWRVNWRCADIPQDQSDSFNAWEEAGMSARHPNG
jgi:hypothetical protein